MGRIDALPPHRPPPPARKGADTRKIVSGVLAAAVIAVGAIGLVVLDVVKLPGTRRAAPVTASLAAATPFASDTTRSERLARAITAIADPAKAGDETETSGVRMARCLSFRITGDEHNPAEGPTTTTFRVSVTNICDSSFNGSDVWFDARAFPVDGLGIPGKPGERYARMIQSFRNFPIEAKGRAEGVFVMNCPACYAPVYRYEIALDKRR